MAQPDCMQLMITGYVGSPKGQEAIQNYLASPDGQKIIDTYLATTEGERLARLILLRTIDRLDIPADVKRQVSQAIGETDQ